MIQLRRNRIDAFKSDGVFGKLILKSDNEEITLFTKEKIWNLQKIWPHGKPMDSCVPDGEYELVRSYSGLHDTTEVFLYNPKAGVYIYNKDRSSAIERYGCIITYEDINTIGEGSIQVGTDISSKNGKTVLTGSTKAYKIFRSWLDKNVSEDSISISWGKDKII